MNNLISVNFSVEAESFPQKLELLIDGKCSGIMPVNVVTGDEFIKGIYNTSGYIKLSSLRNVSALDILNIGERILECIEVCKDYLLFPEEYVLSVDTIYIKEDFKRAKLVYIPAKRTSGEDSAISYLIFSLKSIATENGRTYLDTLGSMLECKNLRISRVIGFIEELKREVVWCGIQ